MLFGQIVGRQRDSYASGSLDIFERYNQFGIGWNKLLFSVP